MLVRFLGIARLGVVPQRLATGAPQARAAAAASATASTQPRQPTPPRRSRGGRWKWLLGAAIAAGGSIYLANVFLPDPRAERDPKHYYSDWQVSYTRFSPVL